jgi:DNA-binding transcriptional LysR family regulator
VELRALRYFVTVAEELHFGRAAARLHIAQPAVSQQVSRLERELGVALLERSPRHVRLTEAGARVLDAARAAITAADRVRFAAGVPAATVRIGSAHGLAARLERGLARLREANSAFDAVLVDLPVTQRLAAIRDGALDIALVRGPVAAPGLAVLPAWREPVHAVLSARHPAAGRARVTLDELAGDALRYPGQGCDPPLHAAITEAVRDTGIRPTLGRPAGGVENTLVEVGADPGTWSLLPASMTAVAAGATSVRFVPLDPPLEITGNVVAPAASPCAQALTAAFRDDPAG